ncbi:hypothetical protein MHM84_09470, partial [Halomonas sp. McH1-25]|uniref:hypothetical protein n=1 Tax=Halomonas sp. McH1-25 TaxID=2917740 RepID=UPI001EF4286F
ASILSGEPRIRGGAFYRMRRICQLLFLSEPRKTPTETAPCATFTANNVCPSSAADAYFTDLAPP